MYTQSRLANRGYFGIGIYNPKFSSNIGSLIRSAYCFGASFVFSINGIDYKRAPTDTGDFSKHMPFFKYSSIEEMISVNIGATIICIEQNGKPIQNLIHPLKTIYLLGSEDKGIPKAILEKFQSFEIPTSFCLNVSQAGSVVMFDRVMKGRVNHAYCR